MAAAAPSYDYRQAIWSDLQKKGWTKNDLALASGLQPSKITRFFQGTDLDVADLTLVSRALGREPGDYLPRSDAHPRLRAVEPLLAALADLPSADEERVIRLLADQVEIMKTLRPKSAVNNIAPFPQRSNGIHITLSEEDRDELTDAIAATGKLAPRKVGRSDIAVPMLGTVAASPDGRLSFRRTSETRDINKYHWDHGVRYVFSVAGESMADMYIKPGDLLYIRPTPEPVEGRPIVCFVSTDLYVKKYAKRPDRAIVLSSENKALGYPDIIINPEEAETRFHYLGEVFGRYGDL